LLTAFKWKVVRAPCSGRVMSYPSRILSSN
jgi:hypothetical protein